MDIPFIRENLKLIRNSDDVNYIISVEQNKQTYIIAGLVSGKEIPLSVPIKTITFPDSPMVYLKEMMGNLYMEDFMPVCLKYAAINKNNVLAVNSRTNVNPKFKDILIKFKNCREVNLYAVKEKNLEKEKAKIEKILSKTEIDWEREDY